MGRNTATWPSASSLPPVVILGNPASRRVAGFQAALARRGDPPARVVPYADLLAGQVRLPDVVPPGAWVRIESPDREWAVERAILARGADEPDSEGGYARLSAPATQALPFDQGAIRYPRQWYLGYCAVLRDIRAGLAASPPHRLMHDPAAIPLLFDKPRCHARLQAAGLPVPGALSPIGSYDELRAAMAARGWTRVFVKLAHGSGASGVVAYRVSGARQQAITTVELVESGGTVRLYNSRRVRTYTNPLAITRLLDALCAHRVQVEQWVPKAGLGERTLDLRVLLIAGRVRHVVVRLSRSPLTNLHLGNERLPLAALEGRLAPAAWAAAQATCEGVGALFPGCLYLGIDLLLTSDYRHHVIAEVNAFGDQLYDTLDAGHDPYDAELVALAAGWPGGLAPPIDQPVRLAAALPA